MFHVIYKEMKIFFSNLGYARGIDGSLKQHVIRAGRHFYNTVPVQEQILNQAKAIINAENPDLCCFVEIDEGSIHSARFNQIEALMGKEYLYHDIAGKYGEDSRYHKMFLHKGKSNAFMAKEPVPFERLYMKHGTKRLIYKLSLFETTILFAHFSLKEKTRSKQFEEVREILRGENNDIILLADFNIMKGFRELNPLLKENDLCVLNKEEDHTFTFHKHKLTLDLCICSKSLLNRTSLKIIPQPFSDHAALLVEIKK